MAQELSAEIRQTVYRALSETFEFDRQYPMASVVPVIKKAGIDYKQLGFDKAKQFLYQMPEFLSFADIVQGGVPQVLVTLKNGGDWDNLPADTAEQASQANQGSVSGDRGETSDAPWLDAARGLSDYNDPSAQVPRDVLETFTDDIRSFCFMPFRYSDALRAASGVEDAEELIAQSWANAYREGILRQYEGKVFFPVAAMRKDGTTPIEVSIRRSDPEKNATLPWFVCYVNTYVSPRASVQAADERATGATTDDGSSSVQPVHVFVPNGDRRSALEVFAYLGPWAGFLKELASIALPENWSLSGGSPYGILRSYITYTFHRLEREGKVLAVPGVMAAFNTGLVDKCYDDIFACFEPQTRGGSQWKFAGFCKAGQQGLGKRLVNFFNPLPETACYFERKEDLFFDSDRELVVDYDHILFDNISRLPLDFLRGTMRDSREATEVVDRIGSLPVPQRRGEYARLVELLQRDTRLLRYVRSRLEDAVQVACKRVRWSFRAAIPCYYPRFDVMSLLLPLCLTHDEAADAALVVQLMDSGIYQGQTIFTMSMAYSDARLICRPESEWLVPCVDSSCGEDDECDETAVATPQAVPSPAPVLAPAPAPACFEVPASMAESDVRASVSAEPEAPVDAGDEELERIMREILNV